MKRYKPEEVKVTNILDSVWMLSKRLSSLRRKRKFEPSVTWNVVLCISKSSLFYSSSSLSNNFRENDMRKETFWDDDDDKLIFTECMKLLIFCKPTRKNNIESPKRMLGFQHISQTAYFVAFFIERRVNILWSMFFSAYDRLKNVSHVSCFSTEFFFIWFALQNLWFQATHFISLFKVKLCNFCINSRLYILVCFYRAPVALHENRKFSF